MRYPAFMHDNNKNCMVMREYGTFQVFSWLLHPCVCVCVLTFTQAFPISLVLITCISLRFFRHCHAICHLLTFLCWPLRCFLPLLFARCFRYGPFCLIIIGTMTKENTDVENGPKCQNTYSSGPEYSTLWKCKIEQSCLSCLGEHCRHK